MSHKGDVFLFSGPSGSGKDTILKEVFKRYPELKFSISTTTRQKRDPSDDEKYTFISKEAFEEGIANELLLHRQRVAVQKCKAAYYCRALHGG